MLTGNRWQSQNSGFTWHVRVCPPGQSFLQVTPLSWDPWVLLKACSSGEIVLCMANFSPWNKINRMSLLWSLARSVTCPTSGQADRWFRLLVLLVSHVQLFATPWTVACQAPLSMGSSRQEYWSGLPFPSLGEFSQPRGWTHVSCIWQKNSVPWATREAQAIIALTVFLLARELLEWRYSCHLISASCAPEKLKVLAAQSCPTLCHPVDCSPPGSSVHVIFQARVLEWAAILFSRGSSQPRDWTWVSCFAGRFFMTQDPKPTISWLLRC